MSLDTETAMAMAMTYDVVYGYGCSWGDGYGYGRGYGSGHSCGDGYGDYTRYRQAVRRENIIFIILFGQIIMNAPSTIL